jgi:hypothetical protein
MANALLQKEFRLPQKKVGWRAFFQLSAPSLGGIIKSGNDPALGKTSMSHNLGRQTTTHFKIKKPENVLFPAFLSGWQDSNLRPPAPKAGAITGLRYTPKWSSKTFKPNKNTFCKVRTCRLPDPSRDAITGLRYTPKAILLSKRNCGENGTRTHATLTRRQISNLLRYHSGTSPKSFFKNFRPNAVANVIFKAEARNYLQRFFLNSAFLWKYGPGQ